MRSLKDGYIAYFVEMFILRAWCAIVGTSWFRFIKETVLGLGLYVNANGT